MTTEHAPTKQMADRSVLSAADRDHNNLYVCCIVQRYPEKFLVNGAVALNHLIQERAHVSREQAFAIVSDALQAGLVRLDKYQKKKLSLVSDTFRPFRDRMIGEIGRIQAEVVTFQWNLRTSKELSEVQRQQLDEHLVKGQLADIQKDAKDFFSNFEQMVEKSSHGHARTPSEAERRLFMEHLQQAFKNFSDALGSKDFVLLVSKTGNVVRPRLKILGKPSAVVVTD